MLQNFDGLVTEGKTRVSPYSFPKVKGVVGVKIVGQLGENVSGVMILVPLRDKAIKLWTETDQFQHDYNKYVLPNFKFSP